MVVSGSELADATGTDAQTFTPIDVKPAFNDPDGTDTLTYTATGLPAGLSLNPTTGIISGTMDSSASQNGNTGTATDGVYTVAVTAGDGNGGTVSDTFSITVGNPAPVAQDDAFSTDQNTTIGGGNVLAANGNGADSDPDGDTPLTVSEADGDAAKVGQQIAGTGGGLFTIAGDGSLSFDPNGDFNYLGGGESAATTATYQLSDGEGGFSTASVTVTVSGQNDGPVPFDPANPGTPPADPNNYIPAQSAVDGETITAFDVTAYASDPDATDTLTFSIDPAELPAGLSFDGTVISGTLAASASVGGDDPSGNPGRYLIPLTVTDEDGATFTTTITYTISNPAPDARDDNAATDEDTAITGSVFADNGNGADSDPDGDTFTVTLVNGDAANVGMAVASSNGGTFTIGATGGYMFEPGSGFRDLSDGEARPTSITYTIDDGNGGADQATLTVTVNGSNNAPIIIDPTRPVIDPNDPPVPADPNNFLPDQTGFDSTPLTLFDVSPYFHDFEGNAMTFSLEPGAPGWLSINPVSGIITGTPPSDASISGPGGDGIHVITVTVTDSNGDSVSTTIDYTISNPPPVSTGLPDQSETAGAPFAMETAGSFSDPDGDTLSFSASGLPTGLSIDPATGKITGTIAGSAASGGPNGNGVYSVAVTADDGQGGTVTVNFAFTVGDITNPGIVPPLDPLPPISGPGDPIILPESDTVVGDMVNGIFPLGGNTGIFNLDHPVTQALYQISPLAVSSSLGSDGLPLTQTVEWIGKTRALLDRSGEAAWLKGGNLRDAVAEYYLGGDALSGSDSSDFVVRTLAWGPVLFIEIASANRGLEWELESVDGKAPGREIQAYGANLFAISRAAGSQARIVMRGADEAGNETLLEIGVMPASGQLIEIRAINGQDVSRGLSDQIRKLVDAKKAAVRSPFAIWG
ncbi:putative Ig domain-containing protein [Salaquimonas pukyongi]|uniref:putative Ig domain-containing protein n=1 Tax=Salaquimonas pukyongi TaxID=2712698 RepID=UPI00096B7F6B|nr:putative Ig domain-containing protein [Salaquimonas pukyongi]